MVANSIILITIDSLRGDFLGCYGNKDVQTPNIDELSEQGVIFLNAFANSPGTPSSFISIFTSTYPLMYDLYPYLTESRVTIAEVLCRKGYITLGINSNPFLSYKYGFNRGFTIFLDDTHYPLNSLHDLRKNFARLLRIISRKNKRITCLIHRINPPYARGDIITSKAIYLLDRIAIRRKRFFMWLHYMDAHIPYIPYYSLPRLIIECEYILKLNEYIELSKYKRVHLTEYDLQYLKDLYAQKVEFIDQCIGKLLHWLRSRQLMDDVALIITSDHGDEFMEHGGLGHTPKLYDELLRIPLIIYHSSVTKSRRDILVDQLDIAPTIVYLIDEKEPFHSKWLGRNILNNKLGDKPIISEIASDIKGVQVSLKYMKVSYRTREWKIIWSRDSIELFNLKNDPKEKENVVWKYPHIAKEFLKKVMLHIEFEKKTQRAAIMRKIAIMKNKFIRR